MMTGYKLHHFLKSEGVPFEVMCHPKRETAVQTADLENIPEALFAKTVVVKIRGKDVLFVIPSNRQLDLFKLQFQFETKELHVEEEDEFEDLFVDAETGAMPPFGCLYGMPCCVDVELLGRHNIYFNGGSHRETIRMAMEDYLRIASAQVGDYSVPRHARV